MKLDKATLDLVAMKIHESYLREHTSNGVAMGSTPVLVTWTALDDDLKEANRAQARDVSKKLSRIGCRIGRGPDMVGFTFTVDELEQLARAEHSRWARQRRSAGWVHGPSRDDQRKHHPDLVSWGRLSEEAREKDRDAIRNIPTVLAAAGLHIERQ